MHDGYNEAAAINLEDGTEAEGGATEASAAEERSPRIAAEASADEAAEPAAAASPEEHSVRCFLCKEAGHANTDGRPSTQHQPLHKSSRLPVRPPRGSPPRSRAP
jgi:hypothetical protein